MCRIELPSVSCGVPGLCHAAIGSASSSHGLGIVEGGSLAGNESASVLSILRSRRQGLGFRRMACRRLVSASSGEVITTKTSLHRLSGFRIGDREKLKPATLVRVHCHAIASFSWNRNPSPAVCATSASQATPGPIAAGYRWIQRGFRKSAPLGTLPNRS